MIVRLTVAVLLLQARLAYHAASYALASAVPHSQARGIHLPLYRKEVVRRENVFKARDGGTASIGIGDYLDVTYNVLVQVGGVETPLVLDTGSADLWVISNGCLTSACKAASVPLYSETSFQAAGQPVRLLYGDSHTGTQASGPIGKDTVGVAGLSTSGQYLASIVDTNTTVLETGSAGILGFGFPAISVLWRQLLQTELNNGSSPPARELFLYSSQRRTPFPNLAFLEPHVLRKRDNTTTPTSPIVVSSFANYGPLFTRLIGQHLLASPLFAITLQRDSVDIGGNVGLLSIGELPSGISSDSLIWVPLREYPYGQGGLPAPPDSPNEVYPLVWEIAIDDVYFDGVKLARSLLSPPGITLSALIDTGNSLIRGPQDVIGQIVNSLGGDNFDCSTPHNLTFEIGGKGFAVDPRDFIHQTFTDSVEACTAALAVTDPPGQGFYYSWSLGDPFLKSVLAAFHYGNITHPSHDPPRIGLLSTIPSDAAKRLQDAVAAAEDNGGNLPATSNSAPSGTFAATKTGIGGVPQATSTSTSDSDSKSPSANAASPASFSCYSLRTLSLVYASIFLGVLLVSW